MSKSSFSNPFAPVDTQPVHVAGQEVSKIAVRVQDDNGEHQVSGILGRDYNLISNQLAYDTASDVFTRSDLNWQTLVDYRGKERIHFDGKRYIHHFITGEPIEQVCGQPCHLGALLYNSYDGSSRFGFELFLCNMHCTNQYISRNKFGFFAIRHTSNGQIHFDINDATAELADGAQRAIAVAPRISQLSEIPLTLEHLTAARQKTAIPASKWGDVLDQLAKEDGTAYGLFQALTFTATHKLSGLSAISTGASITDFALDPHAFTQ